MPDLEHVKVDPRVDELVNGMSRTLRALGFDARWHPSSGRASDRPGVDGHVRVAWNGGKHLFAATIKQTVRPSLIQLMDPPPPNAILVTEHVTENVATALQRAGWAGFVDASGNASLTAPGLAVRVTGRRRRADTTKHTTAAPFARTGLPVTFGILVAHLERFQWTQRQLAQMTKTSLGSVNRVVSSLRGRYLNDDGDVIRPRPLMDAWIASYIETQPMVWASTRFTSDIWANATDLERDDLPRGCLLSSELAAYRQGFSIRPTTALVYCPPDQRTELMKAGRLRHDPHGRIAVRPTFWSPPLLADAREAPRFLMKADLLLEDDPRLDDLARGLQL